MGLWWTRCESVRAPAGSVSLYPCLLPPRNLSRASVVFSALDYICSLCSVSLRFVYHLRPIRFCGHGAVQCGAGAAAGRGGVDKQRAGTGYRGRPRGHPVNATVAAPGYLLQAGT